MSEDAATDELGRAARGLLAACAVLGEAFSFPELLSVLGDAGEHGTARFVQLHGWAELRRSGWIVAEDPRRPERFRFARAGVREQVLAGLPEAERARLERRWSASTLRS